MVKDECGSQKMLSIVGPQMQDVYLKNRRQESRIHIPTEVEETRDT